MGMVSKAFGSGKQGVQYVYNTRWRPLLFVVPFAFIASALIISSQASTMITNSEAENGTLAGCATSIQDSSASNGAAVKFVACGGGTATPTNLDGTGATVPDSNYAIPGGAVFMATTGSDGNPGTQAQPVKTLNQALSLVPSGGTIVVRAGMYRDWYHNSDSSSYGFISKPFTIQSYPHEQVWFDGTDTIQQTSWTSDGAGHWSMPWTTSDFCGGGYYQYNYNAQSGSNSGPCSHLDAYGNSEANHPAAGDPQMLFIDGQNMPEVDQLNLATSGAFYYDWSNHKMYISTNPSGHKVELSRRPTAMLLNPSGGTDTVRGIGFRRYATNEYNNNTEAAVVASTSPGTTFENDTFTQMAGYGLGISDPTNAVINHTVIAYNGFTGLTSNGHEHSTGANDGLLVENSLVSHNNTEHFDLNCNTSCARAGIKLAHMDGFTVKNNIFNYNEGSGFWCDEACTNGIMVGNVVSNNIIGLFYEVSDLGIIASNVTSNNAQYSIRVASADTKIYNNTILTNGGNGGIWVYDDQRNANNLQGTQVGPDTTRVSMVNNVIYNTNNTITAWIAQGTDTTNTNTVPSQFFSAIDYNDYYRSYGASAYAVVRWITPTQSNSYKTLANFRSAQPSFDQNSLDITTGGDPFFVDSANGNYTIRTDSPAYHSGTTLPADVANAIGASTASGQNRGAITWPGKQ